MPGDGRLVLLGGRLEQDESRITVFGRSGFLGRQIVSRLANDGAEVRIAVRHPERAAFLQRGGSAGQITAVGTPTWKEASVGTAMRRWKAPRP